MFKKVYGLYSVFCTQPAFYSQSAVFILPLVRSLQYAVLSLRFTLTAVSTHIVIEFFLDSKKAVYMSYSIVVIC